MFGVEDPEGEGECEHLGDPLMRSGVSCFLVSRSLALSAARQSAGRFLSSSFHSSVVGAVVLASRSRAVGNLIPSLKRVALLRLPSSRAGGRSGAHAV